PDYLRPLWPKFEALHLNTLIVPAYWDLIEPEENRFEFGALDDIIRQARGHRMKLVLLWFGSWKNSMSCYVPGWIKRDPARFPRAVDAHGNRLEMLSPFYAANQEVDARAFAALMRHLREFDAADRTVLMVQVENEVGMIPCARDHSPAANRAYAEPVPAQLIALGNARGGTWAEVYGGGPSGEERFTAWHLARYVEAVAAAGKREYPLPMYVNAALIRPDYQPGQYPSGGPLPHLFELWRAAAPDIDLLSPDIYFRDFAGWAARYRRPGNPLFIPESRPGPESAANGLYAYGALDALGFSVFSIDSLDAPTTRYLSEAFDAVAQLEPALIADGPLGRTAGVLPAGPEQLQPKQLRLGGYVVDVRFGPAPSGGLLIADAPDRFIIAGIGLTLRFRVDKPGVSAGILNDEEGRWVGGHWRNRLWLGGDQTNQGRFIRLPGDRVSIQRVTLYRY
ncbi:MAG: DUF5597 domain-containing protein, partial [Opitutaceae bacterium]